MTRQSRKAVKKLAFYGSIALMLGGMLTAIVPTALWELRVVNQLNAVSFVILAGYLTAAIGVVVFTLLIPRSNKDSADRYLDQPDMS